MSRLTRQTLRLRSRRSGRSWRGIRNASIPCRALGSAVVRLLRFKEQSEFVAVVLREKWTNHFVKYADDLVQILLVRLSMARYL